MLYKGKGLDGLIYVLGRGRVIFIMLHPKMSLNVRPKENPLFPERRDVKEAEIIINGIIIPAI